MNYNRLTGWKNNNKPFSKTHIARPTDIVIQLWSDPSATCMTRTAVRASSIIVVGRSSVVFSFFRPYDGSWTGINGRFFVSVFPVDGFGAGNGTNAMPSN